MNLSLLIQENDMQSPQSTVTNPSTDNQNISVLFDITNKQGYSNSNHTHSIGLTDISTVSEVPPVNLSSLSVTQQKLKRRSLNKICQVASNLAQRLEQLNNACKFFFDVDFI